jgi:6-pyruvoyltetrahydropterin/6-carboxytetrahydropterin synthase
MGTRGAFKVTVTKEDLVFASAHFITFAGHRCETLHGHNYRVGAVVEGGLEPETWFVLDFAALKRVMKRLTDELDHRVLLPRDNPKLTIAADAEAVRVAFDGRPRYVFPTRDCVILPIPNTTVEMLAQYLAGRVRTELAAATGGGGGAVNLTAIEIEVEENFGQSASYRETLD